MEIRDLSRFFRHLRSTSFPLALVLTTALSATGCSRPTTLQEVRDVGVLHVITRVAPSIYYEGRDAPTGYDYELASRFAEELGVELRVRVAEDNTEILSVLSRNYAHIGMAGLVWRPEFEGRYHAVPTGIEVQSVLVYHRDAPQPETLAEDRKSVV